jgi:L-2-hydroxyglutarate oxidase LhgO
MTCDIVIIGAGVVGLAVASQVARKDRQVFILEKNESFGLETSSRNSGTIHTSVLSPPGSLNARFSLEGNSLIYQLCREYNIDCLKCGKMLVAGDELDVAALEGVMRRQSEGINMQWLDESAMHQIEPEVKGIAAVLLPEAGVVDVYGLMRFYLGLARLKSAELVCLTEVTGIEKTAEGYRVQFRDSQETDSLDARIVINCAGLYSDRIAAMAGIDIVKEGYKQIYLKGEYYTVDSSKARKMNQRLVYPLSAWPLDGAAYRPGYDGRVSLARTFIPWMIWTMP